MKLYIIIIIIPSQPCRQCESGIEPAWTLTLWLPDSKRQTRGHYTILHLL